MNHPLASEGRPHIRLLLIGPYPPPYGGIAITLFDLKHYLKSKGFSDVHVLNIGEGRQLTSPEYISVGGRFNYFWKLLTFSASGYILHLETNGHNFKSWLTALMCSLAGILNSRKTIVALGSGNVPNYLSNISFWKRAVIGITLKTAGVIVCRNQAMVEAVQAFGIGSSRVRVVPGFVGIEGRAICPAPTKIQAFCKSHAPVVGATVLMSPEYGIPLLCESLRHLTKIFPKIGLILMGVDEEESSNTLEVAGLEKHIIFAGQLSPGAVLDVMKRLNAFVRPTYFDGDSLSVREALAIGIPVVASETPDRPQGVITFQIGDCSDLCQKLEGTLNRKDVPTESKISSGSGSILLSLYLRFASCTPDVHHDF